MFKKIFMIITLMGSFTVINVMANSVGMTTDVCMATAPNDGTYTKTNYSVSVYTESGHFKGTYPIYLHQGKRYISFNNTWICIQGKSRFGYRGNWYVIK